MHFLLDKHSQTMNISMFKIFGYRKSEIGKLYLNGNLLVVTVSALIGIPLAKIVMNALYPYLVSNVSCSIDLTFPWYLYAAVFAAVIVLYFIINKILTGKINKISSAEILKNRE